jgi:hypothetical protein
VGTGVTAPIPHATAWIRASRSSIRLHDDRRSWPALSDHKVREMPQYDRSVDEWEVTGFHPLLGGCSIGVGHAPQTLTTHDS